MKVKIFLKSSIYQYPIFVRAVDELDEEGIPIVGVELQLLGGEEHSEITEAFDKFSEITKYVAVHPPTNMYINDIFDRKDIYRNFHYAVIHPKAKTDEELYNGLRTLKDMRNAAVENLPWEPSNAVLNDPLEIARYFPRIVLDIPHLVYDIYRGKLPKTEIEALKELEGKISVVHVADGKRGYGEIPVKPSKEFLTILKILLSFNEPPIFTMEPYNGHLNNFRGHKAMARKFYEIVGGFYA